MEGLVDSTRRSRVPSRGDGRLNCFPAVPLSGVGTMQVTNPTITTLKVSWNPADGNVQGYKVIYVPEDGGLEIVVSGGSKSGVARERRRYLFRLTQFGVALASGSQSAKRLSADPRAPTASRSSGRPPTLCRCGFAGAGI